MQNKFLKELTTLLFSTGRKELSDLKGRLCKRYQGNPILQPSYNWEARGVFNPCPIKKDEKIFLLYRALSEPEYQREIKNQIPISRIGITESEDGIYFSKRRKFIIPEYEWEKFGCEDPRITKLDEKYFVFYTALSTWPPSPEGIKIGVAISKDLEKIEEKHLVTPFNSKAMTLFPSKIGEKIWAILTVHTDKPPSTICLASFDDESQIWSRSNWKNWYSNYQKYALPLKEDQFDHVEVGAPPVKTKYGWLLFYSHIKNYLKGRPLFTVKAVLLDLNNPFKILGKTRYPLLVPEESYELVGNVPDVVFPSGSILHNNYIYLYYGSAYTVCCLAIVNPKNLLKIMLKKEMPIALYKNSIIEPILEHTWEAKATFNPAAIYLDGKIHLVYRAMSYDNTSVFGYANSKDGIHIDYRHPEPIYVPREPFELKLVPGANSGCEDPRLTCIGDIIYMLYTAFDGKNPERVALTSISKKDFLEKNWNWVKPKLISPPGVRDKNACLFPEKFEKGYLVVHRMGNDIDYTWLPSLEEEKIELKENVWIKPRRGMWDGVKVGAAAPPIKTEKGWILFYHGFAEDRVYRVGAVLLDLEDPTQIVARTYNPILEPSKNYEIVGQVPNVVFPCGAVKIRDYIYLYYGGADRVCGVSIIKVKKLLKYLDECKL